MKLPNIMTPADSGRRASLAVAIGDSITSGYGLNSGQNWFTEVADAKGWRYLNLGDPGAGFLANGDSGYTYDAQINQAIEKQPQIVFISATDNDYDLSQVNDLNSVASPALQRIRAALPHAVIIGLNALSGAISEAQLTSGNQVVRQAVQNVGGHWIDIGQPFGGNPYLVQADGEHPTAAGQQLVAQRIITVLNSIHLS